MTEKVKFTEFPECCGAAIVSKTWVRGRYSHANPTLFDDIRRIKQKGQNASIDTYMPGGYVNGKRRSVLIAITIPYQTQQEAIFRKHKGICVGSFKNANSLIRCRVWMIPLNASAKPECVTRWKKRSDA